MSTIGADEATSQFPQLLERAENGERITITRHGKAVAQIVPVATLGTPAKHDREKALAALERIRARRKNVDFGDMTWEDIKKLRDEGRPGCD